MFENPLLLEGGAMRGLYTSGILDVLIEKNVQFAVTYGVSAGVLNGVNYVSRQAGRTAEINYRYINDSRYLSPQNLLHGQSIFNFDFLFNNISRELPFDFQTFESSPQRLIAVAANCETGKPVLFEKGRCVQFFDACAASCSMPLMSRIKIVDGMYCLDGGVCEPVALYEALGACSKPPILVMTRQKGYRKSPLSSRMKMLNAARYRNLPKLYECMNSVPERYNAMMERIDELEAEGKAFVIRPEQPITISRLERDVGKLRALHDTAYEQAQRLLPALLEFCGCN